MGCLNFQVSNPSSTSSPVYICKLSGNIPVCQYHYYDYFRVYYVIKGYITVEGDSEKIHLGYGDICIIPPTFRHTLRINTADTEIYSCSFSIGFVEHILQHQAGDSGVLTELFNTGGTIKLNSVPTEIQLHLQNLMDFLLYEYQVSLKNSHLVIQNCLAVCLCVFSELLQAQQSSLEMYDKHSVMYCISYIKSNYDKAVSLNDMIELSRIPKKEFCQRFRRITGHTVHDFLNKVRIEKALNILKQTEYEITLHQLSTLCGYDNYTTFYRNFIKYTGLTPVKYIQINRNCMEDCDCTIKEETEESTGSLT